MTIINMTQTCKANNISEFGRTRGGWMKMVEGVDKSQNGGYSFIGDRFVEVGNFDSNIANGCYLDQSTSVEDGKKIFTMNLFKIEDGTVTLLKSVPKNKGWEINLWKYVEEYFHETEDVTAQDIINVIKEMTTDENIIKEVINRLQDAESESMYAFRNWYEVKAILSACEIIEAPFSLIEKFVEDSEELQNQYVFKCDNLYYKQRRVITSTINLHNQSKGIKITEETPVHHETITADTFKRSYFQKEMKSKEFVQYLVRTAPNNTGYHNKIEVVLFYFEEGTIYIKEFTYFVNRYKADQTPSRLFQMTEDDV